MLPRRHFNIQAFVTCLPVGRVSVGLPMANNISAGAAVKSILDRELLDKCYPRENTRRAQAALPTWVPDPRVAARYMREAAEADAAQARVKREREDAEAAEEEAAELAKKKRVEATTMAECAVSEASEHTTMTPNEHAFAVAFWSSVHAASATPLAPSFWD